ncbi:MAG: tetrahydromethanopterin S-methyltransferase subunit C [Methanosphaera sp.]|nr:tetrahydromethanopterin S-methyltransferase subunit C [Methanosphaera sp.]
MSDDLIPNQLITIIAILGCLICLYASSIVFVGGIFAIVSTVLATVYGTNNLRHVGKYSLGTGVPSIVYMLAAIGVVSYFTGMASSFYLNQYAYFPIISLIFAVVISYVVSLVCRHIFKIQVEILSKSFISISISSMFVILSMSAFLAQTYYPTVIYDVVVKNGLILLLLICTVMAVQNPYNSCMGPNEDQYRTLSLSASNAFLMMVVLSIIALLMGPYWYVYLLISIIGWFVFFRKYIVYSKHQAASIKRYGLWPNDDGEN